MKTKFDNIVANCQVRFDRGDPGNWKHSDFLDLSRQILRDTKVSISPNTLKRIFGKIAVDEYYIPQQATIQALDKYGLNVSTADLGERNSNEEVIIAASAAGSTAITGTSTATNKFASWLAPALLICIALAILIYPVFFSGNRIKSALRFAGMEGLLPATAFFEYEVPESKDSLFLNFGDKSPLLHVAAGKAHHAHAYLYPGVFTATLESRKETLQSVNVYVRSNKWIGLGFRQGNELAKNYYEFSAYKSGRDSLFHISNKQLREKGIDTSGLVYTRLCNFTPVAYAGENFVFTAKFKNLVDENGVYCKSTQFQVSGMKNRIRFRLATPGCSNRISNNVSELSYIGSKVNLSKFALDLGGWTSVKLVNHNKRVTLYVNGKLLYNGIYEESIGTIKGVFLEFEGTAVVKSCQLITDTGEILYNF